MEGNNTAVSMIKLLISNLLMVFLSYWLGEFVSRFLSLGDTVFLYFLIIFPLLSFIAGILGNYLTKTIWASVATNSLVFLVFFLMLFGGMAPGSFLILAVYSIINILGSLAFVGTDKLLKAYGKRK